MKKRFKVEILSEAFEFIKGQEFKTRKKIFQNLNRAQYSLDPAIFKKLNDEIWEFKIRFASKQYRLLAFWDKRDNIETLVIATHGFIKKTHKTPTKELKKAEKIREKYYKRKENENL